MAWKTIYKGTSGEEAAMAVANSLRKADREREEYLQSKQQAQVSTPSNNSGNSSANVAASLKRN